MEKSEGKRVGEKLQTWIVTSNRGSATVDYLTMRLAPFFEKHPGVEIEWRLLSWSTAWVEIIRAYKQGTPPDIFEFGTTWLGMLTHLGALRPVPGGLIPSQPIAPYLQEVSHYRGTHYGVPWTTDTTCFMARTDVLARLNLDPKAQLDWDGFHNACATIMEQRQTTGDFTSGEFPKSMSFPCRPERVTLHRILPWLWAGGYEIPDFSSDSVSVLTSPIIRPGLNYVRQIMRVGQMTLEEARSSPHYQQVAFFNEGAHAFLVTGWYSIVRGIAEGNDVFESDWPTNVMSLPRGPQGAAAYGGGSLLGVSPLCKNPELAWDLVEALLDPNLLANWSLWTGSPPAYPCPFWEQFGELHAVQVLKQALLDAKTYPTHPVWSSFERTLSVGLSELLWYLVQHDYDDHVAELSRTVDAELNRWLQLAWEVQ